MMTHTVELPLFAFYTTKPSHDNWQPFLVMRKLSSAILDSSAKVIIKLIHIIKASFSLKTNFQPLPISWKRVFSNVPVWISNAFSAFQECCWQPSGDVISNLLRISRWVHTVPKEYLKQWGWCLQISTQFLPEHDEREFNISSAEITTPEVSFSTHQWLSLDLRGLTKSIILLP